MRANLNDTVRVKLTDTGREIHQAAHRDLAAMILEKSGSVIEYHPPQEDADGWSSWQLWYLMRTFGPHIKMGAREQPFEMFIDVPVPTLKDFGWAPGGYTVRCVDCPPDVSFGNVGIGEKLSWRCEKHAQEKLDQVFP